MCQQIDRKEYIEKLLDYTISDVGYLLHKFKNPQWGEGKHAGPILMTVMSGIDALGGTVYGLDRPLGRRLGQASVDFMVEYMEIPELLSEFIYSSVRCGLFHHGMPKRSVEYELWNDDEWSDICDSNDSYCQDVAKHKICINVAKMADKYLEAARRVKKEFNEDQCRFKAFGLEDEIRRPEQYFEKAFSSINATAKGLYESSSDANTSGSVNDQETTL